jgi:restriction endonuclease NaeI
MTAGSPADAGWRPDGAPEPLPGQLALPGLEPEPADDSGQYLLPGMEDVAGQAGSGDEDPERDRVSAALRAADPEGLLLAATLRRSFDLLLDGQHTGRYRWDQLHKTEKTHAGTLVEIGLQRSFGLVDGTALDYSIAGVEVDCKFSHRSGGWMIPPEAEGYLMLLVQASDEEGTWSAGLVRARETYLTEAGNRDLKRTLNDAGRGAIEWLAWRAPLPENALLRLPERDTAAILGCATGQQAVNELFRRALGRRISRAVVATVARQEDYMKRVRGGGGARDQLRGEGIVIFGDYAGHQALAAALGLPSPGPGEFVSARLTRRGEPGGRSAAQRYVRLDGTDWVLAATAAGTGPAPRLPRI